MGFLFLILYPGCLPPPPPASCHTPSFTYNFVNHHLSHTTLSHTIFHIQLCHTPSFTHNFVTHYLSHTTLSTTIFPIQLCHTPSFTYKFVTHHLSHTTLSHTIFLIQHCHTPSFAYNFVTHHLSHTTLSRTIFHTQLCHTPSHNFATHHLSHTTLSHTIFHTQLCQPPSFPYNFVTHHRFAWQAWQAWHNLTSTFVLRGMRGTISHPPSFRVAGVALMALGGALGLAWSPVTPVTSRLFAWQAWRNLTSTIVLRGMRGAISHPPSFRVAGVALMAQGGTLGLAGSPVTPRHFAWQVWHNLTSTFVLRGRRGAISHPPSFCVAGVALMALGGALGLAWSPVTPVTPRHFAWQAWHNLTPTIIVSRGRRGTHGTGWRAWTGLVGRDARDAAAFCVAGVAQPHIHLRFAWHAWRNLTSNIVSCCRRGTHGAGWRAWTGLVARDARDAAALCVAGVAQPHIHLRFAWQAWRNLTPTIVSRGRRGAHGTGWRAWTGLVARDARDVAAFCVAGEPHIHHRFAWNAWRNLTSTIVSRGRRGTHGTGWRPWTGLVARDARDAAALCVAGVAQPHIHLRFAWQAWHNLRSFGFAWQAWHSWHWVARLDWLGRP